MNLTRHLLSSVMLCLAVPAWGGTPALPISHQIEGPHALMDDLNLLLLFAQRTGQAVDPVELAELSDGRASADIQQALTHYRAATSASERFERRTVLEFALQERQDRLRAGVPYLLSLASKIGPFDAAGKRFPLQLSLDSGGRTGDPGRHCLQSYRVAGAEVVACMVSASLASGDPIFSSLPVQDAASAALLAARHAQGKLRLYALAEDAGAASFAHGAQARSWSQPVRVTGLLLVDAETSKVLGVAKAQGTGQPTGQAPDPSPGMGTPAAPGRGQLAGRPGGVPPGPVPSSSPPTGLPELPGRGPGMPPQPQPQPDQGPMQVADAPVPDVDRLLSLLSLAVYSDADKLRLGAADIADLEAKIGRIENDPNRNEGVRIKELKKLAIDLGKKRRRLAEHEYMLVRKEELPAREGLTRLAVDPATRSDRLYYERYLLRDGRHVLVFRGTDSRADFETDFQLATTPDMLNELGGKLSSKGGMRGALGGWMRERADRQVASNPAAFQLADMVVAALIRSGVPRAKIVLTGHSLGGGLAQYAGLRNGVGLVVGFNPAPLTPGLTMQLPADAAARASARYYVSFVPRPGGDGGTFDPVSHALADVTGLHNPASLRVLGDKRVVTVCNDLEGEDFQAFMNSAQGVVTNFTLATMAVGRGKLVNGGTGLGAAAGLSGAGTEPGSAALTGGWAGRKAGTALGAGLNCLRHPFLCSAAAVGGGFISIATRMQLPEVWAMYTAHSMKLLNAALRGEDAPSCAPGGLSYDQETMQ